MSRTESVEPKFMEVRGIGTSAGVALTTTVAYQGLVVGTNWIEITPRNFASAAAVARFLLSPYLITVITRDSLTTKVDPAYIRSLSDELQDDDTTVALVLNSFDTAANGDYIYIGSHIPFAGVRVDGTNFNSNASTLTVNYWNGRSWVSISATDGTASAGATFAQDGSVTWTVPTQWASSSLNSTGDSNYQVSPYDTSQYWTRWEVSAALDATVNVLRMQPINRFTTYMERVSEQPYSQSVDFAPGGISTIQALTDAGTANLVISAASYGEFTA